MAVAPEERMNKEKRKIILVSIKPPNYERVDA
jgi:hypothetical protein